MLLGSSESFEGQAIWRQQYRHCCWVVAAPFRWDLYCLAGRSALDGCDVPPCPFSPQLSRQLAAFGLTALGIENSGGAEMR